VQVIGYVRVSRVGGRSGDSFISPTEQRKAIEALAARKGLQVSLWLDELDASGGDATRPKWNEAIQRVEAGEAAGILVWNLRRFSRSLKDALNSLERIEAAGGKVYSATEQFDSSTSGRTMRNFAFVMAQDELERARDSFRLSTTNALARGVWIAAKVPFGYLKDEETRQLIPDPITAPLVRELFERRAGGESVTALMRWLASEGYPMAKSTVGGMLVNQAYLGLSRQGKIRNESAHEPLVSREVFDRAQAARGVRPARTGALASQTMLRSLCRCATCGSTMLVGWTHGRGGPDGKRTKKPAYHCQGQNAGGCAKRAWIRAGALDAYVNEFVGSILRTETPAVEIVAASERLSEADERLRDAKHGLAELQSLDYTRSGISLASHTKMIAAAEARFDMARSEFANAKNEAHALGVEGEERVNWDALDIEQKRHFLHGLVDRIVVTPAHRKRLPVHKRVQIIDRRGIVLDQIAPDDVMTITWPDGRTEEADNTQRAEIMKMLPELERAGQTRTYLDDDGSEAMHEAWAKLVKAAHPGQIVRRIEE
jgi:site-specific DNA recombinase